MAEKFKIGDLVWAKMKGFPLWPARIWDPTNAPKAPKTNKPQHYVYFFGSHNFAWILEECIVSHSEQRLEIAKSYKKIPCTMQEGIIEIETVSKIKPEPCEEISMSLETASEETEVVRIKKEPPEENVLQLETYPEVTKVSKRKTRPPKKIMAADKVKEEPTESQLENTSEETRASEINKRPQEQIKAAVEIKEGLSKENSVQLETISEETKVSRRKTRPPKKIMAAVKIKEEPTESQLENTSEETRASEIKKRPQEQIKAAVEMKEGLSKENSLQLETISEETKVSKRKTRPPKKIMAVVKIKEEPTESQLEKYSEETRVSEIEKRQQEQIKAAGEIKEASSKENSLQLEHGFEEINVFEIMKRPQRKTAVKVKKEPTESQLENNSEETSVSEIKKRPQEQIKAAGEIKEGSTEENSLQLETGSKETMIPEIRKRPQRKAAVKIKEEASHENLLQLDTTSEETSGPKKKKKPQMKAVVENTLLLDITSEETNVSKKKKRTQRKIKAAVEIKGGPLEENGGQLKTTSVETKVSEIKKRPQRKAAVKIKEEPSDESSWQLATTSEATKVSEMKNRPQRKINAAVKVIKGLCEENSRQLETPSEETKVSDIRKRPQRKAAVKIKEEPLQENLLQLDTTSEETSGPKKRPQRNAAVKIKKMPSEDISPQLDTTSGKTKVASKTTEKQKRFPKKKIDVVKNNSRALIKKNPQSKVEKAVKVKLELPEENSLKLETTSFTTKEPKMSSKKRTGSKKKIGAAKKNSRIRLPSVKKKNLVETKVQKKRSQKQSSESMEMDVDPFAQHLPSTSKSTKIVKPRSTTRKAKAKGYPRLKNCALVPTEKIIGFLGLGMMGTEIVKSLLKTGHTVVIWNRTMQKCEQFTVYGVETAPTPAEIVLRCDIIFCCVSDAEASKAVAFGENGVLEALISIGPERASCKGYVEMSTIDPFTSIEIGNAVENAGGVYLEAPVVGSRQTVKRRGLTVISAGCSYLFHACGTCFASFTPNCIKISGGIGNAAKLNMALALFSGTAYAALNEAMEMLQKLGLNRNLFLCCLGKSEQVNSFFLDKGWAMISEDPTVHIPLKNVQKDMEMAISLAQECHQPLKVAVAANEKLKRAAEQFPEHDATAVRLCNDL